MQLKEHAIYYVRRKRAFNNHIAAYRKVLYNKVYRKNSVIKKDI